MRKISFTILLLAGFMSLMAQDNSGTTTSTFRSFSPDDQWELGLDLGVSGVVGDLNFKPGLGAGLHVRKSLDHIFSLRFGAIYGKTSGDDSDDRREFDLNWISGSAQVVATLNNIRFNRPYRRVLIHGFAGAGFQNFKTTNILNATGGSRADVKETGAQIEGGAGVSFRLNKKFNISLEETAIFAFGKGADELDGDRNEGLSYTTYRDVFHFPHLSFNINLGGKSKSGGMKVEPLYWVNPMMVYSEAVAALEARPVYDPTDTDGDGVIDAIDQEKDSPKGARVDSRGVTLDSDSDGVADYKDKEPYSPPGFKVDPLGVADVPKPKILTEKEVNDMIDAKLKNFKLPAKGLTDWFLPMVHFDLDRYNIKRSEYEKLFHVATVLKQNPEIKVAVLGHTDRSATDRYNNVLSYNRAKAAIDFLVTQHGISRDRLVLTWGGEEKNLVPTNSANYLNRRVEFKVATNETEMGRPDGPEAGSGGKMKGNTDSGY